MCQMVCLSRSWESFPFCCLEGTCRKAMEVLPPASGRLRAEKSAPNLPGHLLTKPEDWIRDKSGNVLDFVSHRFNNFPQFLDRANVIAHLITGSSVVFLDVFVTLYAIKKCNLNNGKFMAVVFVLYAYLLSGHSVEDHHAALQYLQRVGRQGPEALKATLRSACLRSCPPTPLPRRYLPVPHTCYAQRCSPRYVTTGRRVRQANVRTDKRHADGQPAP